MSSGPEKNSLLRPVEESCGDADTSNSLIVVGEEADSPSAPRLSRESNEDHMLYRSPSLTASSADNTSGHRPVAPQFSRREARAFTLRRLPVSQSFRDRLADAGFFSDGYGNDVRCFDCGIRVGNWSDDDDPLQEHRPDCAFVQQLEQRDDRERVRTLQTAEPEFREFESYARRWESFQERWPKEDVVTADNLARCGLFYRGDSDTVVCFHCGGRLDRWERGDNPEMEHRRIYPHCPNSSAQRQAFAPGSEILSRSEAEMIFSLFHERGFSCRQIWEGTDAFISRYPGEQITADGLGIVLMEEEPEEDVRIPESNLVYARNRAQDVGQDRQRRGDNLGPDFVNAVIQNGAVRREDIGPGMYAQSSQQAGAEAREGFESSDAEQQLILNQQLKQKVRCRICRVNDSNMMFLPCKHLRVCENCSQGMDSCTCGSTIEEKIKVYMS